MFGWLGSKQETPSIEVEQPIMTVKGEQGSYIYLYEKRVVLATKSWMVEAAHGVQPEREFYLSSLAGVQIKAPGFFNGYITFLISGDQNVQRSMTSKAFGNDPYTVFFNKKTYPEIQRLKAEIDQRR